MSEKLLFVFNPFSGKALVKNYIFDVIDIFTKAGYDVTVRPTQGTKDAYNFIKANAPQFDAIVVSGGDGTLNEAVSALMTFPKEERKHLGYIPAGTTNDFAQSRGIPKDVLEATLKIAQKSTFKCDIGSFNEKHFAYVGAFGAFTDISYDTPQEFKNLFGQAAYFLEGIKRLANLQSYRIILETDTVKVDDYFFLGIILNSTSLAGFNLDLLHNNVKIDLSDGLFEIILVKKPVNLMQMQEIFNAVMNGDTEETEQFKFIRTQKATIRSDEKLKWTLDGEFGGEFDDIDMVVEKEAITFLG